MHTQTASASEYCARLASSLHVATGLGLYLLTLTGEVVLGASVRWLLTYLGASALGAIVPLGPDAGQLAWLAALLPLGWSLLGLTFPGRGFLWTRRVGARRPSADETMAIEDARQLLLGFDPSLRGSHVVYVLDDPLPAAAARGRSMILTRGLLESESVAPVLAHELGHTRSLDGRLTEALNRLELWSGPLEPRCGVQARSTVDDGRDGLLPICARWTFRLAAGGRAERLLSPLWAAYWRGREYAADAYAASLGLGEDLALYLADQELPFDAPQRRLPFNRAEHPPVALRIERLHDFAAPLAAREEETA